ncbi:TPA: hypothetical protein L5W29_005723 [Pseudomonas aeruginosa]|nr:hypothetical protein [Pseudomonas aeruginosa]HCE5960157.1 IS66 family insertion sequence element accessory protein TnpB [Pseudomonas aeruginosa]
MKYRFMNVHRHQHAITTMCKVLLIGRAGFHQWLHKPVSDRDQDNHRLLQLTRSSYAASRGVYGARRVFGDHREAGKTCGKHRIVHLMRANRVKVLVHDSFGIWLAARRLNRGRFVWSGHWQGQQLEISPEQLQALVGRPALAASWT